MPQVSGAISATAITRGDLCACSRTSRYNTPAIFTLSIESSIGDLREGLEPDAPEPRSHSCRYPCRDSGAGPGREWDATKSSCLCNQEDARGVTEVVAAAR